MISEGVDDEEADAADTVVEVNKCNSPSVKLLRPRPQFPVGPPIFPIFPVNGTPIGPPSEEFNKDEESANKPNPASDDIDVNDDDTKGREVASMGGGVGVIDDVRGEGNEPKVDIVTEVNGVKMR